MVLPYTEVVAGSSTNVTTPTTEEINQGNNQLTPYNSAINNGYYRQMSQGVANVNAEIINAIEGLGGTPSSSNDNLITALRTVLFPTGSFLEHGANTPPSGFLAADGSAISRTTYADLFAVIGTTWGAGNGTTTFNIPDCRGYFLRGWTDGGSVDIGRVFASTQTDAFQGHRHANSSVFGTNVGGPAGVTDTNGASTSTTAVTVLDPTTDTVNGVPRTAAETRPVNKAVLICIKY